MSYMHSENEIESIFSMIPVAAVIQNLEDGKIIEANKQAESLFGFTHDEIIGLTPIDLSPEYQPNGQRSEEFIKEKLSWVLQEGADTFFWWHQHKTGKQLPCLIQLSKLPVLGKQFYIGFVTEIHRQKEIYQQLLNYRQIVEVIDNPVSIVSPDYKYQFVNPAYQRLFRKSADDIVGHNLSKIIGREAFDQIAKKHYDSCFEGNIVRYQTWYEVPHLGKRLFDVQYFPHYNPNQVIDATISCISDITDITEVQNKLSSRSKLDQILIEISASFIDASVENTDEKISQSLKMIGEFLELDRCSIGYLSEDKKEMLVTHVWDKFEIPSTQQSYRLSDFPWLLSPFVTGQQLLWHHSCGMPDCSEFDLELLTNSGMKCFAGIPVAVDGKLVCCLGFSRTTCQDDWNLQTIDSFPLIASLFGQLMQRRQSDLVIHNAFLKINDLKTELEQENISLRNRLRQLTDEAEIIGESDALQVCLQDAEHVASEDTTVLILGETGTGKELLAQAIHNMSPRQDKSMIKVNCAALPANLIESELFGREKGAYTGAMARHQGRFELADGSTIFLDEIGDLPLELQSKLLRVLQEGKFERLGSTTTITVNVRVIAATNIDLYSALEKGTFRKDLFYRLNVFPITLPPIKERREDIPLLVWAFVEHFNKVMGKSVKKIPESELKHLQNAEWPGNVRELKNTIERSMIISKGSELTVRHESKNQEIATENSDGIVSLADVERSHIIKALQATYWRVSGEMGAAKILNIKPTTLEARMKKLGIVRPPK